uniref:Ribosomal protein S2 n=1 Tax=Cladosiphon okamuranus TaxID=309737 RepID=A0A3G5FPL4_9PHAE|nr:ribosomal protein S2 [Cladosiphon okamuranus]AYW52584.1 ribosomal protein S2 [Cladosiphon okamuranus]
MLNKKHARLISLFVGYSGYLVPRPYNEYVKISKTIYPFLLGKRNIYYFYDLEKSLYGIRATMEVLKNIVANEGKVLFISDSPVLHSRFNLGANLNCIKWKRGSLAKSKNADLVFLSGVEKENLVEAHRKCLLLVGIGSSTMSKISYPFNLNCNSPLLSDWLFGALSISCVRGLRELRKKRPIPKFLGKGRLKGPNKKK